MSPEENAQHEAFQRFRLAKMRALDAPTPENEDAASKAFAEFERLCCPPSNVVSFRRAG